MYHLNESVKKLWTIAIIRKVAFLAFTVFLVEWAVDLEGTVLEGSPFGTVTLALFFIGIAWAFVWPTVRYKKWRYDVRPHELYLERGVMTHIRTTAPYVRIQHLDVRQSFFERMLGLATLVIYTAGTKGADVTLPGLPEDYAYELRDALNNYTKEDGVDRGI